MHLTGCSCYATYAFQSYSTLYSWLNVKEIIARKRREIWSLNEYNWTGTNNNFVCKKNTQLFRQTGQMIDLSCEYLSVRCIDCIFFSCHLRISERIQTLYWPERQGICCSKLAPNLKFKWPPLDWNPQPLSSKKNTQPFSQTRQMIEISCEYSSVPCI